MKIAYILDSSYCISPFNGIRIQAITWAEELINQGHVVNYVNPWEKQDWENYDVIHVFGQHEMTLSVVQSLSKYNNNIFFSPIIDTIEPLWKYRVFASLSLPFIRISTMNNKIKRSNKYIKGWFARSEYEKQYIAKAYGVEETKIKIIPLSYRLPSLMQQPEKDDFCLHVSKITDKRKNVMRLLQAAVKYKFRLVLVGSCSHNDFPPLQKIIESNDNITYLGRVSDKKLVELYTLAKVFALPSINEGVGLVALEAAIHGCNIVITKIGGPKEYYEGLANLVNPYSVDEIGMAIVNALNDSSSQPFLMEHIKKTYNINTCINNMVQFYSQISKRITK
jgi:glycosyltransferase involved in cell wall biosynthesis